MRHLVTGQQSDGLWRLQVLPVFFVNFTSHAASLILSISCCFAFASGSCFATSTQSARQPVSQAASQPPSQSASQPGPPMCSNGHLSDGLWRLLMLTVFIVINSSRVASLKLSTSGTLSCGFTPMIDSCYPNWCDGCSIRSVHHATAASHQVNAMLDHQAVMFSFPGLTFDAHHVVLAPHQGPALNDQYVFCCCSHWPWPGRPTYCSCFAPRPRLV